MKGPPGLKYKVAGGSSGVVEVADSITGLALASAVCAAAGLSDAPESLKLIVGGKRVALEATLGTRPPESSLGFLLR